MAKRKPANSRWHRQNFTRTAVRSKKINLNPTIYRGGIRL